MLKNLIVDVSETLMDDVHNCYEASMAVLEAAGKERMAFEEWRQEFTTPFMRFYEKYAPGMTRKIQGPIYMQKMMSLPVPQPYIGALTTLRILRRKGVKLGLLTANPREWVDRDLRSGLMDLLFDGIVTSAHEKTRHLGLLVRALGIVHDETAYMGDMEHDMEAAREVGLVAIGFGVDELKRRRLEKTKPDHMVTAWPELLPLYGINMT